MPGRNQTGDTDHPLRNPQHGSGPLPSPERGPRAADDPRRDNRQRRTRDQRLRFVELAARIVASGRFLRLREQAPVCGDERLTARLVDALPESLREHVLCGPRGLDTSDPARLRRRSAKGFCASTTPHTPSTPKTKRMTVRNRMLRLE